MADFPATEFARLDHPAPTADTDRDAALANPGFGKVFSDHMVSIDWHEGKGWHNAQVGPRKPLVLDPAAAGWDWVGANLNDGGALMAFRIRGKDGATLWAHPSLRDGSGRITQYGPGQVAFTPRRSWQSPRTQARYPVEMSLKTGNTNWLLSPLQDDQELDSRQSTGSVYWEGAVRVTRDGAAAGHGYLELTGYVKPLKL